MAYQVTEAVLKHSQAEGAARMVLFALSVHAQPDGCNARPGNSLLAKETKLTVRGVEYAIKSLLASGEICRETMGGGSAATSYRILMPGLDKAIHPPKAVRGGVAGITSDTPESRSGGTPENGNITPECSSAPNTDTPRKSQQVPPKMVTGTPENGDIAYKEEPELEPEREPEGEEVVVVNAGARETIAAADSQTPDSQQVAEQGIENPPFAPEMARDLFADVDPLKHPAVNIFCEQIGQAVSIHQAEEMGRRVTMDAQALAYWSRFLRDWRLDGYGSHRVSTMLTAFEERYQRHKLQEQRNAANNQAISRTNGASHGSPAGYAGGYSGGRRKRDLAEQVLDALSQPIPAHWGGSGSGET